MDCLNLLHLIARPYHNTHSLFQKLSSITSSTEILDLGSGGAEHLEHIINSLKKGSHESFPKLIASDIYPETKRYELMKHEIGKEYFDYVSDPVNALDVSNVSFKAFSVCSMFHHLDFEQGRELINAVLKKNAGILILELNKRSWKQFFYVFFAFPFLILAPFFARKKSVVKFVFGTFIPLIPIMVIFDGFVSTLRSYDLREMKSLIARDFVDKVEIESREMSFFGIYKGSATLIYPK